jgi:hypothetical protein
VRNWLIVLFMLLVIWKCKRNWTEILYQKPKQWNTTPKSVNAVKNLAQKLQNCHYVIQEEKVRWTLRILDVIDVCSKSIDNYPAISCVYIALDSNIFFRINCRYTTLAACYFSAFRRLVIFIYYLTTNFCDE